ncbi:MAG: choice-of-anchor J domain-containing protein [Muribaculaceae bacterium]|nr:choice-of-anchor J domain-containing protein [Muribaculaceae bacterium]
MKKSHIFLPAIALGIAATTLLASCDNNWEYPPMVVPVATIEANTTIEDLKTDFFQPGVYNYSTVVGEKADGSHYIIEGYVTSNDESGNIFKKIYIQDATGGIYIGIDAYDLYESYKPGQKVVVDVTGLAIGGYGGAMNIGEYNASGAPNRLSTDVADKYVQVDGLPGAATLVEPLVLDLTELPSSPLTVEALTYQNRLVRINGVTFDNAGRQTLSTSGSSGVSQSFGTAARKIVLYTSGYSDFWDYYCPVGEGDVIGILSCYGNTWQLVLNDIDDLLDFEELAKDPTAGSVPDPGDADLNPDANGVYTVAGALNLINTNAIPSEPVKVRGIISSITELSTSYGNATYEIKDDLSNNYSLTVYRGKWLDGASFTSENQIEVGGTVVVEGTLKLYNSTPELDTNNKILSYTDPEGNTVGGDSSDKVEAVTSLAEDFEAGVVPAGWTQVQVAGDKAWYVTSFSENYYIAMTGYKGTAPFDQYLITPPIDMDKADAKNLTFETQVNGYGSKTSKFEVYVITDPTKPAENATKLEPALPTAPESGYSSWVKSGELDLSAFKGIVYIAFRYSATSDANYATWCLDNVGINQ